MEKIFLQSLGCEKNLSDAEHMLYLLKESGFIITDLPEDADVILVNSCCFIADALEESIETVLSYAELKKTGSLKALIVSGCMSERFKEEVKKEIPEVDALIGTNSFDEVCNAVLSALRSDYKTYFRDLKEKPPEVFGRIPSRNYGTAYLKIAEGCDKNCSYCIIPKIRGPYRSIRMEYLTEEAKALSKNGVKELILVAQETTLYGIDLYNKKSLHVLIRSLSEIEGIEWIRIMYTYPEEIYDELLFEIRDNKKVLHYLDMPIQHASDKILKSMGRRTRNKEILLKIKRIREIIPDIAIRSTFILGYPGESEEDVSDLLDFLDEARLDRVGAFTYSREEGTKAAELPGQIDEEIKASRLEKTMLHQQRICFDKNKELLGTLVDAIIEGYLLDDDIYVGRTYRDAPDIDGLLFIENVPFSPVSGDIIRVMIKDINDYDLIGEYYEPSE